MSESNGGDAVPVVYQKMNSPQVIAEHEEQYRSYLARAKRSPTRELLMVGISAAAIAALGPIVY